MLRWTESKSPVEVAIALDLEAGRMPPHVKSAAGALRRNDLSSLLFSVSLYGDIFYTLSIKLDFPDSLVKYVKALRKNESS